MLKRFESEISKQYRALYCVIYIGFDIARVNEYYGEAEAEEQLRFAAHELSLSTRDNEFSARVSCGGFALVHMTSGETEAGEWTEALLSRLDRYTEKYGKDYHLTFSAGVYMLKLSDDDCNIALSNARQGYNLAISTGVSLAFFRSAGYPIDIVKIDRSILNAAVNSQGIALLKGMISLAHSLGMTVLCEGVETAGQVEETIHEATMIGSTGGNRTIT